MTSDLDIYRTASVLIREHGEDAAIDVIGYPQIRPHALARLRRFA